ncbi:hypothetical protein FB451DRAFT_1395271 [Mycena latifolia]|nr:hypothetical protein FB451DRAFT_1395271 [Mycena latifolia]
MPVLPTTPPATTSFLTQPLVGLGGLLMVVVVVSGGCYVKNHIVKKLAERRRVRAADLEKAGNAQAAIVDGQTTDSTKNAALSVFVAAREALHNSQITVATKNHCVALHKALMTEPVYGADSPIIAFLAPSTRILRQQGEKYAPGRIVARSSPTTSRRPPPISPEAAFPVMILSPAVLIVEKLPVVLTRSARILARLADDTDTDSGSEYSDSDDDEFAERIIPAPLRNQSRVLADSPHRNLHRVSHIKRSVGKTSKMLASPPSKSLARSMGRKSPLRAGREKENAAQIR